MASIQIKYQKTEGHECPSTQKVKQLSVIGVSVFRLLSSEDDVQAERAFC